MKWGSLLLLTQSHSENDSFASGSGGIPCFWPPDHLSPASPGHVRMTITHGVCGGEEAGLSVLSALVPFISSAALPKGQGAIVLDPEVTKPASTL